MKPCRYLMAATLVLLSMSATADDADLFWVTGTTSGSEFTLTVDTSPEATKAFAIFSEPSHTLLLATIDSTYVATQEGSGVSSGIQASNPIDYLETTLPSSNIQVVQGLLPGGDDTIRIVVWGLDGSTPFMADTIGEIEYGGGGGFEVGARRRRGSSPQYRVCGSCSTCSGQICGTCSCNSGSLNCSTCTMGCNC